MGGGGKCDTSERGEGVRGFWVMEKKDAKLRNKSFTIKRNRTKKKGHPFF